jgi:hypothetical protein
MTRVEKRVDNMLETCYMLLDATINIIGGGGGDSIVI